MERAAGGSEGDGGSLSRETGGTWTRRDGSGGNTGRGVRVRLSLVAGSLKRVQETAPFLRLGRHRGPSR